MSLHQTRSVTSRIIRRLASLSAIVIIGATAWVVETIPAHAASGSVSLACHASMSNSRPKDYTTTHVNVSSVAHAAVTTTAHFRTTTTSHSATTNRLGKASIAYRLSRATPGFRVIVRVSVHKSGRSGNCSTSFTPHR
jgi:hypothetical protein